MGKLRYLITLCVLCAVGYLLITQLNQTRRVAANLLRTELVKKIEIQLRQACNKLKRCPDSGKEFETLVLGKLELERYPQRMMVQNFIPGNKRAPAFFQVKIIGKTMTPPTILTMEYYGSEYQKNFHYKGKLVIKSPLTLPPPE